MNIHICKYCKREVPLKTKDSLTGHLRSCRSWRKEKLRIQSTITKEFLEKEYLENEKSYSFVAEELGLKKHEFILSKLKEFNIQIRSPKEDKKSKNYIKISKETSKRKYGVEYHASKGTNTRDKINKTCIKRYGTINPGSTKEAQEKIKQTCLKRYGVTNTFLLKETQEKKIKTCLERYGVENPWKVKEFQDKALRTKYNKETFFYQTSKNSQELFDEIYKKLNDNFKNKTYYGSLNKEFGIYDKNNKKYQFFDFVISSIKKCIEFNGDYWHMNPKLHESGEFNKKTKTTSNEIWKKDEAKLNSIKKLGFSVLVVWESEYNENREAVINKCLSFLNS